jgi:hypothetical protein
MAFKIPDNTRYIGTAGNFGTIRFPVPETGGPDAVVFRDIHPTISPATGISPAIKGRRLSFTRLDMTGISSIDVNMMLATPTNPLGANAYNEYSEPFPLVGIVPQPRIRVFGDPRDSTHVSNTAPILPAETAFDIRMRWAKIEYSIEDGIDTSITANGTVINTHALVAYNPPANPVPNLSPTSPLRTFSPYTIPVPASLQKNNVTLHIYQAVYRSPPSYPVPGSPAGPFIGQPYQRVWYGPGTLNPGTFFTPTTISPSAISTIRQGLSTGYGWAVKSVDLGANNGGVYTFQKTKTYGDPTTDVPVSTVSPEAAEIASSAIRYFSGTQNAPISNGFIDTRAITISPGFKSFDGTSANVGGLVVSDKIAFTNTSVRMNSFNTLNSLDFQSVAQQMPFRGTTGYVGRSFMDNTNGGSPTALSNYAWATKFVYASENWQVIRGQNIGPSPSFTRTLMVNSFPAGQRKVLGVWQPTPGSTLTGSVTPTTAGGNWIPYVGNWYQSASYFASDATESYGHSTSHGYQANFEGYYGGEPVPVITPSYIGTPAPEIPFYGPIPGANRIRGSIIRFPFANFTDLNEIGDGGSTAYMRSTWSGPSNMYFYGGAGQPAFTYAAWWPTAFAATSLTTSFKFPFASLNLVTPAILTLTATGAGAAMDQAAAATDHVGAWVIGGRYLQATAPAVVDYGPLVGAQAPGAPADSIVYSGAQGVAGDPTIPTAPYTGYTESAVRNVQRFPWASETFASVGTIGARVPGTPLYLYGVSSAGSDSNAYFGGRFYSSGVVEDLATWGKFPFAAVTAITGSFGITPSVSYRASQLSIDVGIGNSQSPETSYSFSYKFPFSSEYQVGIVKEISIQSMGLDRNSISAGIDGFSKSGAMNF